MWTDGVLFSLDGDIKTYNCRIWSNPRRYMQTPLRSPKSRLWCGFIGSFIIGTFFWKQMCLVNVWKTATLKAQCYLTFLGENVVLCFRERSVLYIVMVCKMQQKFTLLIWKMRSAERCMYTAVSLHCAVNGLWLAQLQCAFIVAVFHNCNVSSVWWWSCVEHTQLQ